MVETPLLPQALDAEEALLGSILIDSDAWLAARSLKPADFYREAHATLFATMRQLDEDGLAVDVVTVTTRLERTGQLERAGGTSYVLGLVNAVPTAMNAHYYADLVKKAAEGRQVIQMAGDLASIGYHSTDPARAALRAVETLHQSSSDALLDLSPEEARARLATLVPSLCRFSDLLEEDFPETRWIVPDLLPEGLTLLAAKPKLGKSWLALGLALAVATGTPALGSVPVEQGEVLYLALEDSFKRLHTRGHLLRRGTASQGEPEPLPAPLQVTTEWPRLDQGGLLAIKTWLQAYPNARLVILDTLAKIRGQGRSATLYGDDYASLEDVQRLAHDYNVAILVIHHTGKESRDDPLDEVNATQGLNGVADNVLVLRRERGKPTATLIGDGRELNGIERALCFDLEQGGWRVTEPPAEQPKTPERAEILDLLKASDGPMSTGQIAKMLGKSAGTISMLLGRMVRDGDVALAKYGKYIPVKSVESVESGDSSPINKVEKKNTHLLFNIQEEGEASESRLSTLSTLLTPVGDSQPITPQPAGDNVVAVALPTATNETTSPASGPEDGAARGAALPEAPPEDFRRFAEMVAREMHSSVVEYKRMATPDADDPYTLQPSGERPASLAKAARGEVWPIAGECTGVFCAGECVCGEHICDACGCEAGALVDHHPWYYDRRVARRGSICEYCYAPATVASRWKTPMCERCWQIASRGHGINPRAYQPRPFGPMETDEDDAEDMAGD
jgi:hypothetical protein